MAEVTLNLKFPTPKLSTKASHRIVGVSALLAALAVGVTSYGPGFGLPAAYAVYVSSGVTVVSTILAALTGQDVTPTAVV